MKDTSVEGMGRMRRRVITSGYQAAQGWDGGSVTLSDKVQAKSTRNAKKIIDSIPAHLQVGLANQRPPSRQNKRTLNSRHSQLECRSIFPTEKSLSCRSLFISEWDCAVQPAMSCCHRSIHTNLFSSGSFSLFFCGF